MSRFLLYFAYAGLATFLVALPALIINDYVESQSRSATVSGTVVETGNAYKGRIKCVVSYEVADRPYVVSTSCSSSIRAGDVAKLRYDPDRPAYPSASSSRSETANLLVGLFAWLLILGVTVGSYLRQRRSSTVREHEDPRPAKD